MNKSPFEFSDDNKRYHTLNYYNKYHFGKKICKAVLDCGFSCPNIDGTKSTGGCIFCDGGSGYFTHGGYNLSSQLSREKERICNKHGESARFIAYFQANSNTYAPLEVLRELYYTVLNFPNVCGISIGTRADCLSDEIIGLLEELNSKTDLTIELGMQSIHENTIKLINRCYTHKEFCDGFYKLKRSNIRTCIHIINGLPFETPEMMIKTAEEIARLNPEAVKLQMLHVIKGTVLAEMFSMNEFNLLEKSEYIDIIINQLEILPPETVIERITGDGDKSKLIAPMWSADKISVLGSIDKKLAELDTWQGKKYHKKA